MQKGVPMIGENIHNMHWYPSTNRVPFQIWFSNYCKKHNKTFQRKYLDVHWDYFHSCRFLGNEESHREKEILDRYMADLNPEDKYFAVIGSNREHISFPKDTLFFLESGGVFAEECKESVIIPYFVNPRPKPNTARNRIYTVSFLGNYHTHPLRESMAETCRRIGNTCVLHTTNISVDGFYNVMEQSIFSLCPRGTELTSYRLYESLFCGAIPVYVSDYFSLPFQNLINWEDICINVSLEEIHRIPEILLSLSGDRIKEMQDAIKETVEKYLNEDFTCRFISEIADLPW